VRAPERIGEFVVEERLGEGGMGAVYRVVHERTGARHALKLLTMPQDPEALRRFAREGEALAAVDDHPNVVRVNTAGEWSGRPYLVMQLCTGGDLKQRLRDGPLPPREAARIVADVARGIAHVHARGIIHRDLKPENVLFDDAGPRRA
jgi:eukaryotic-like serine/threonine-protein kinase